MTATDWIRSEIFTGLQRLVSLGLNRMPATDVLPVTAENWIVAFNRNRALDCDLDTPRIRAAFDTLVATRDEWPAPRHFAEAFDAVPRGTLAITKQVIPADPARAAAAIAEIAGVLRVDGKSAAAGPDA